jgi:tRNA dimethylallyltransferase
MKPPKPVVILLGPTAVGKTDISIKLAHAIGAEIISVDSRSLYRGMDIGTAKPTPEQMEQVRHRLVDVAEPSERWSLSRYLKAVRNAINDIHAQGKVALLVGGTGQYLAAIVEGWEPPPKAEDAAYRQSLREYAEVEGHQALHDLLASEDPLAAEKIDARNVRRVIRALEIYNVTGIAPSELRNRTPPDYSLLILGLKRERAQLYERIDERIQEMLRSGWVEEVAQLLEHGVGLDSTSFSAIGYRQIAKYLQGECELQEAVEETQRLSRQFVRRQDNWFRRFEPDVHWFDAQKDPQEQIVNLVSRWLEGTLDEQGSRSENDHVSQDQEN